MNHKVWLITFGIVAALVLGGAGFYAFSAYGKYAESIQSWDAKVGAIETLERKVPYPNKANSEALAGEVSEYAKSVESLFQSVNAFQRELNMTLASTEFQQLVSTKVQQFRKFAEDGGMEITEASEFQMGFDEYSNVIPVQQLVPILDYELEAIDYLLKGLVDSGVENLASFERDPIPGESGAAEADGSGVVQKYPVRLRFTGTHDAFQDYINKLANDKSFFYIVRVLKVRNEVTEGPIKLTEGAQSDFPLYENPDTKEVASSERLEEWGYPDASESDLAERAKAEGFISSNKDARVLMGQEKLNVFMVVDIVRFISPEEVAANEKVEAEKGGRKR